MEYNTFIERWSGYPTLFSNYTFQNILISVNDIFLVSLCHKDTKDTVIAKVQFIEGFNKEKINKVIELKSNYNYESVLIENHFVSVDDAIIGTDLFTLLPMKVIGDDYIIRADECCSLKQFEEAIAYLAYGASLNDSEAFIKLGNLFRDGIVQVVRAYKAILCYKKAIELNNPMGYCMIGLMYETGTDTPIDYEYSLKNYNLACDEKIGYGFYLRASLTEKMKTKDYNIYDVCDDFYKSYELGYLDGVVEYARCIFAYDLEKSYQNKAIKLLHQGNNMGYVRCGCYLGYCYHSGSGVVQDYKKAMSYYQIACSKYHYPAYVPLAKLYKEGHGVEKDIEKFKAYILKACHVGNTQGMQEMVEYYLSTGNDKDVYRAIYWMKQGIKKEDEVLLYRLGELYENGIYLKQDIRKSSGLFLKSARQGYIPALIKSAKIFIDGYVLMKNYEISKKMYLEAIKRGSDEALIGLSIMYRDGMGVEKDIQSALDLLSKAIDNKCVDAIVEKGLIYCDERFGLFNINESKKLFTEALDLNSSCAAYYLSKISLYEDRHDDAKEFLLKASKLGDFNASLELSELSCDDKEKFEYLTLAKKQGCKAAYVPLAIMHLNGFGLEGNAFKLLYEAECFGDKSSSYHLACCYCYGIGCIPDGNKAIDALNIPKDKFSHYLMGMIYYEGLAIRKNRIRGLNHLKIAAEMGHVEAIEKIELIKSLDNSEE